MLTLNLTYFNLMLILWNTCDRKEAKLQALLRGRCFILKALPGSDVSAAAVTRAPPSCRCASRTRTSTAPGRSWTSRSWMEAGSSSPRPWGSRSTDSSTRYRRRVRQNGATPLRSLFGSAGSAVPLDST